MARLRALLVDLSGTIHVADKPTPGAADAIRRLRQAGIILRWVSNTSKESKSSLLTKLHKMGLDVRESELFTSLSAVRQLVDADKLKPIYLLSSSALSDFPCSPSASPSELDSVVIGLAPDSFNYRTLNNAFRLLSGEYHTPGDTERPSPRLIATHRALYVRDKDDKLSLGPGGFVTALEESSGVKAEVGTSFHHMSRAQAWFLINSAASKVGKPSRAFFELALKSLEKDGIKEDQWEKVGMVGDDYRQDTGWVVQELGLQRFLVQTGKYRSGDESRLASAEGLASAEEGVKDPEWCGESFEKLVDWVLRNE